MTALPAPTRFIDFPGEPDDPEQPVPPAVYAELPTRPCLAADLLSDGTGQVAGFYDGRVEPILGTPDEALRTVFGHARAQADEVSRAVRLSISWRSPTAGETDIEQYIVKPTWAHDAARILATERAERPGTPTWRPSRRKASLIAGVLAVGSVVAVVLTVSQSGQPDAGATVALETTKPHGLVSIADPNPADGLRLRAQARQVDDERRTEQTKAKQRAVAKARHDRYLREQKQLAEARHERYLEARRARAAGRTPAPSQQPTAPTVSGPTTTTVTPSPTPTVVAQTPSTSSGAKGGGGGSAGGRATGGSCDFPPC